MEQVHYEVLYIDKFADGPDADRIRERIRRRFGLSQKGIAQLSTGEPVVVKTGLELDQAKRYLEAFRSVGGVVWMQPQTAQGEQRERRHRWRRSLLDRRDTYRGSAVQPDRRQNCGRRSSDMWQPLVLQP